MTIYTVPTFAFDGTGSPVLDGFVGAFGGVGPNRPALLRAQQKVDLA